MDARKIFVQYFPTNISSRCSNTSIYETQIYEGLDFDTKFEEQLQILGDLNDFFANCQQNLY